MRHSIDAAICSTQIQDSFIPLSWKSVFTLVLNWIIPLVIETVYDKFTLDGFHHCVHASSLRIIWYQIQKISFCDQWLRELNPNWTLRAPRVSKTADEFHVPWKTRGRRSRWQATPQGVYPPTIGPPASRRSPSQRPLWLICSLRSKNYKHFCQLWCWHASRICCWTCVYVCTGCLAKILKIRKIK